MTDATLPSIPPIQRTDVDGVTTLWMDEPGPMVAALCFRVGQSDEPTPMGGISHMVEHLALSGLGIQDYDHNGYVAGHQTVFTSVGRPDEIKDFLESVAHGLVNLPTDRLLMERRILREEREQRAQNIGDALRWYRFGYAGQGRGHGPGDNEQGLEWLGPEPVYAWARRWFTRQNAILWLTGPVPPGLRLDLPDGEPAASPGIEPTPSVSLPAHMAWDGPGASLGYTATRSAAILVASNIAHRRARQKLRFDQGLVYDVQFEYGPVAPSTAHVTLGAECPDERVRTVIDGLLGVVRDLAADGPTQAELGQEMTAYLRQYDDRDGRINMLAITAADALWDGPVAMGEQSFDERRQVDPAAASSAMASSLETLLVLAHCEQLPGLSPYPAWSSTRVEGREYGPSGFFLPGRKPKERLIAGRDGVTVALGPQEWLTVRYADCVASVHVDPTFRILLSRDGTQLAVEETAFKDGIRVIEEIDRAIPADLVACAEHGIGGLEDPVSPDESVPITWMD